MELSEQLLCLFSAQIETQDGSYIVKIPKQELRLGDLQEAQTYRVAMLSGLTDTKAEQEDTERDSKRDRGAPDPPVVEGETREVEIKDLGEQGDGITRVERGYVVIVPDTELGERVTIEITDVQPNVAFAEVVERQTHFE